jgi:hypothetical protein
LSSKGPYLSGRGESLKSSGISAKNLKGEKKGTDMEYQYQEVNNQDPKLEGKEPLL